jgi:hypothetical protein
MLLSSKTGKLKAENSAQQPCLNPCHCSVPGLEDGRLDSQHMSGLYGHRSNSSASSSPPAQVGQSGQPGDGGLVPIL